MFALLALLWEEEQGHTKAVAMVPMDLGTEGSYSVNRFPLRTRRTGGMDLCPGQCKNGKNFVGQVGGDGKLRALHKCFTGHLQAGRMLSRFYAKHGWYPTDSHPVYMAMVGEGLEHWILIPLERVPCAIARRRERFWMRRVGGIWNKYSGRWRSARWRCLRCPLRGMNKGERGALIADAHRVIQSQRRVFRLKHEMWHSCRKWRFKSIAPPSRFRPRRLFRPLQSTNLRDMAPESSGFEKRSTELIHLSIVNSRI